MATTIKSTDLDFENIKASLKDYFKNKDEFQDYDFEASGLNNILDVLAYNTHINGLTANYALNESFLQTAQLRSSVVSHAETLGYDVRSMVAARALVKLTANLSSVSNRASQIQLAAGATFSGSIGSGGSEGLPVFTLQNAHALVQVSPNIIKVACFFSQHSPIFGHAAS